MVNKKPQSEVPRDTGMECPEGITGLTAAEVREREQRGEVNSSTQQETKTYGQILVKNALTGFNVILFVLGVALVALDEALNALAATGVIFINTFIATFQEFRAKRRLDKIALLMRPMVNVVRDGRVVTIDQTSIVKDDVIVLTPGEQALVDGELVDQKYLEMDESLLTGESDTVRKNTGDKIFSGSFCIAGEGYFRVSAFGEESFASQLMTTAKKNVVKKTPLQMETQTITLILMILALIMSVITAIAEIIMGKTINEIVSTLAIILDIVPIALFLLIVITYMIAAVRMADTGVLLQESSAVESLSHVDTVCMDKTGTITTNKLTFKEASTFGTADHEKAVRQYIGSIGGKNRTIDALENRYGSEKCEAVSEIRFTSARKYSAAQVRTPEGDRRFYLGAPSVLAPHTTNSSEIFSKNKQYSDRGLRTVLFAETREEIDLREAETIPELVPLALFAIEDEVRPDCRETIDVFLRNNMDIKVISGDDPVTVDALFTIANIPGERKIISGDELAQMDEEEFDRAAAETNIFGRMKPDQKEKVIDSLRKQGRYVAMVGDGVNDVKSLKKAQVGVALESGSGAARGVADMVLVNDNFSALPVSLVEGKRTVTGMRDILKIYISRNFALAIIISAALIMSQKAPFTPVQNFYYSFFATTVSAFFMAIWAHPSDNKDLVLPGVLRYTIPTAIWTGICAVALYHIVLFFADTGVFCDYDSMVLTWDADANDGPLDQRLASAIMILFLGITGALQLLVVQPFIKAFSVEKDRKLDKDIRPVILCILLVLGAIAFYNIPFLLDLMEVPQLPIGTQMGVVMLCFLWMVVHHFILRSDRLDPLTDFIEDHYKKAYNLKSKKENDRALSGKEEKWRM